MKSIRLILLATAIGLVLGACSADRQITIPSPEASEGGGQGVTQAIMSNSAWIGPDGGRVSVTGCCVQVPAGALSVPTLVTMTRNADGTVELGPHAQTFGVKVELLFVAPLLSSAAEYQVQWFDDSSASWTTIPSYVSVLGRAALLEHFSLYQARPVVK